MCEFDEITGEKNPLEDILPFELLHELLGNAQNANMLQFEDIVELTTDITQLDSDDSSLNTNNDITIRSIVPCCSKCQNFCVFEHLSQPKNEKCSYGDNCRSNRYRAYEFCCKSCHSSVCLLCSISVGSVFAVDNFVGTAKNLTSLCGNNGKFQVLENKTSTQHIYLYILFTGY